MPRLPQITPLLQAIKKFLTNIINTIKTKLFSGKKIILICAGGGAAVLLLTLSVMLIVTGRSNNRQNTRAEMPPVQQSLIPPQEIFLPQEPDFVPGIILDREQRETWTAEDASPFWQDPLRTGEEPWRSHIETIIDELMEHVL